MTRLCEKELLDKPRVTITSTDNEIVIAIIIGLFIGGATGAAIMAIYTILAGILT